MSESKKPQGRRKRNNHSGALTATKPKRGSPGFLLTCETGREVKCQREGIELLLYYYNSGGMELDHDCIEEKATLSLDEEISMLKKKKYSCSSDEKNPFTLYETGCRGIVFLMHNDKLQKRYFSNKNSISDEKRQKKEDDES